MERRSKYMLTTQEIFRAQSKFGVGSTVSNSEQVTYKKYLDGCREVLSDKTPLGYYSWTKEMKAQFTDDIILKYVVNNNSAVEGYVDENGDIEQDRLINRLHTDIADNGILKDALEDDEVQEIQINDYKTIYVVKGGKSYLYVDDNGNPYQFVSDEELKATLDRLIYSATGNVSRLTETNPLLNARTSKEGYRVSAVDSSAVTPDMSYGFGFPVTTVTIRKYSASRLTFADFEKFNTLVPKMSRFLRLAGRADTKVFCVGATSSGKTTLLQALIWELPDDIRSIFIQNPTELMLYDRETSFGVNRRNALHWEAQEVPDKLKGSSTTPTMANLIGHTLRNTPDIVIPGEIRSPEEFGQTNRVVKTGHRVMSTFHAEDTRDAGLRWANENSTLGGSVREHLQSFVNSADIIIAQKKLNDGTRKVIEIGEFTGKIDNNTGNPEVNIIFQFNYTGEVEKDPNNPKKILKIGGYFEQVSPISDRLKKKFYSAGISKEELQEFLVVPERIEGASNIPDEPVGLVR